MKIKQVIDYFWNEYNIFIHTYELLKAGVILNTALLLDIARRTHDRNIQRAQCESTCKLCNQFVVYSTEGDAKCLITNRLRENNCECSCNQRCASKYIERIQKAFAELEYAYQYNTPNFLNDVAYNLDEQAVQEFQALTIEDESALYKYLHQNIVEQAKKSAQRKIENAEQIYKQTLMQAQEQVEKSILIEKNFWSKFQ